MKKQEAALHRLEIVNYRLRNPRATLEEIGNKYGLTRERIRQILSISKVPTRRVYDKVIRVQKRKASVISVKCEACGGTITRRMSEFRHFADRHYQGHYFCNNKCKGKWTGTRYGWGRRK
jgi:hypothetical protein